MNPLEKLAGAEPLLPTLEEHAKRILAQIVLEQSNKEEL